jgi:hypothetical protein
VGQFPIVRLDLHALVARVGKQTLYKIASERVGLWLTKAEAKMFQRLAFALVVLFSSCSGMSVAGDSQTVVPLPSPLIENFDIWGSLPPDSKLDFYSGWASGLFTTTKDPGTLALGRCLEKLNFQQILAMIDKRYANHREGFKNPMSTEMIEAVTVTGSPCEGITASKDPTVLWALPGKTKR